MFFKARRGVLASTFAMLSSIALLSGMSGVAIADTVEPVDDMDVSGETELLDPISDNVVEPEVETADELEPADDPAGGEVDDVDENSEESPDEATMESGEQGLESESVTEEVEEELDVGEPAATSLMRGMAPMAADPACSYADPGTGAYASTLCWINMAGFTTAYEMVKDPEDVTCSFSALPPRYTCTSTGRYVSVLGEQYGVWEHSATSANLNQSTARANARNAVITARNNATDFYVWIDEEKNPGPPYWGAVTGYPVSFKLSDSPNSLEFSAKISVNRQANAARGLPVTSSAFPFGGWAGLGNNGLYTGVQGRPGIRMINNDGPLSDIRVSLGDIKLTKADNTPVYGYSIVTADGEVTDGKQEYIKWSHQGGQGFRWLPNDPAAWASAANNQQRKAAAVANACAGTPADAFPANSDIDPAPTRECLADGDGPMYGAAMLQISPDPNASSFTVHQEMRGGGAQGVAFGIMTAGARVSVEVDDRIIDSVGDSTDTNFTAEVYPSSGDFSEADAETAQTGTSGDQGSSHAIRVPVNQNQKMQFNFADITPSDPYLASYERSWECFKTSSDSSEPISWPNNGSSEPPAASDPFAKAGPGEFIECTVTFTPPYLTLEKVVDNANGGDAVPNDWDLTAEGDLSTVIGTTGVKKPVAVGTYELSESEGPAGYELEVDSCDVSVGEDTACTFTNTSQAGSVSWIKIDDQEPANLLGGSAWTITGPGHDGTGVTDCVTADESECAGPDSNPNEGEFLIEGLSWGEYTIEETTTPEGYTGTAGFTFEITGENAENGHEAPDQINTRILGSAQWTKVDPSGAELDGSVWVLTGPGHNAIEIHDCTANDAADCAGADQNPAAGGFAIEDLEWGEYTLTEVSAPAGYILDSTEREFTIGAHNAEGGIIIGEFENVPVTPPDLPLTGGIGRDEVTIGGFIVITLGLSAAGLTRLRTHRREVA